MSATGDRPCPCGCGGARSCNGAGDRHPFDLSSAGRRIGDHASFKEAMLARLGDPSPAILSMLGIAVEHATAWPLRPLRSRADDDPAITLLDAWAMACDVLAFHSERIADEASLRSATERWTVEQLASLVGYRTRPGVAATTTLAFTVESAPGSPTHVPIPAGTKVQTIPDPGQTAQMFETIEALDARPELNAAPVRRTTPWIARGAEFVALEGLGLNVRAGDLLLIVEGRRDRREMAGLKSPGRRDSPAWNVRRIVEATEDPALRRTRVRWRHPIDAEIESPTAHVMRQRANVFGHNAPSWALLPKEVRDDIAGGATIVDEVGRISGISIDWKAEVARSVGSTARGAVRTEWPGLEVFVDGPSPAESAPKGLSSGSIDLAGAYPAIVEGSWVVLRRGDAQALFQVDALTEASRSDFGLSGPVTRITISGPGLAAFAGAVRTMVVLCQSEPVAIADPLRTGAVTGAVIELDTLVTAPWSGRRIVVEEFDEALQRTIVAEGAVVGSASTVGGRTRLSLVAGLSASFDPTRARVLGNVAVATHGETVHEFLGSGDSTMTHQRFTLRQAPLTHVAAANESGAASTLSVRVGELEWTEVETLVGRSPGEAVFSTAPSADPEAEGRTTIQFGDGLDGPRLPAGTNNIRAVYRRGIGLAGNAAAGQVSQLMSRPLGLKAARNPLPAEGAADPEPRDQARANAPRSVLTLGRVVSLRDHEDFARGFAGVGKALAQWADLAGTAISGQAGGAARRGILVTVAGAGNTQLGAAAGTITLLRNALMNAGAPFTPIAVVPHRAVRFRVVGRVMFDGRRDWSVVAAAIEAALRRDFGFETRRFAQPVAASEVVASIHAVAGVVAVDIDELRADNAPPHPTRLDAAAATIGGAGQPIGAELLTYVAHAGDLVPSPVSATASAPTGGAP